MNSRDTDKHLSKFLSLLLRHKPETIGITLDSNGWTEVDTLITKLNTHGTEITREQLEHMVDTNPKKRFAFNEGKTLIRASQGHSVNVELAYEPQQPPAILYHGTGSKNTDAILADGLQKMQRHHVHLSKEIATALMVGQRHGKPIIFTVDAEAMFNAGFVFYQSENGVWLTDHVPAKYLKINS